jgi:hypothetical protein
LLCQFTQLGVSMKQQRVHITIERKALGHHILVISLVSQPNVKREVSLEDRSSFVEKLFDRQWIAFPAYKKVVYLTEIETVEIIAQINSMMIRREKVKTISLTQILSRELSNTTFVQSF